jgi:kynurenine formamidase
VDLNHPIDEETIYWPTEEHFHLEVLSYDFTEPGVFYAANRFEAAEHGGTHIDAPIHFARRGRSVDEIPLEQLLGPAVVVDVSAKAMANRDYEVGVNDLTEWEAKNGEIPEGAIVFLRTGYGRFWPDRLRYMGTDRRGEEALAELHFPGLAPEAARWLVESRKIAAVGLDTPGIDAGQSKLFETHRVLFQANVPAIENVARLEELPPTGAFVVALPMKIRGGSGAPVRVVAWIPRERRPPGSP